MIFLDFQTNDLSTGGSASVNINSLVSAELITNTFSGVVVTPGAVIYRYAFINEQLIFLTYVSGPSGSPITFTVLGKSYTVNGSSSGTFDYFPTCYMTPTSGTYGVTNVGAGIGTVTLRFHLYAVPASV